jgi:hypothetical protein
MALDATSLLGAPQIAGVQIAPRGTYKEILGSTRGNAQIVAGSAFWRFALRKQVAEEHEEAARSDAPPIGNRAFAALTEREFALVSVDASTRMRLVAVISTTPRSDIASAELGKSFPGASMPLTITLRDGQRWLFEVPWLVRRRARKLVAQLAG